MKTKTMAREVIRSHNVAPPAKPVFIRLPPVRGRCAYTGMSRSAMADLCVPGKANNFKPPVRSLFLKLNKYSRRGIRLIDFASLMNFLRGKLDEQSPLTPPDDGSTTKAQA